MSSKSLFTNKMEIKTSGNFLQPNNLMSKATKPWGYPKEKNQANQSDNPFFITPSSYEPRNFFLE